MSISSKLFVIASGETNVYGSSYYWNFRTSSFKQVAYLILFTVAENVAHNLCCQIRAGDNSSTCTFTTEKPVTCTGRHVRIIYKSFSILFNCRSRPFRKLTFQPTYNVCSHSNTLTKLASTFKTLQNDCPCFLIHSYTLLVKCFNYCGQYVTVLSWSIYVLRQQQSSSSYCDFCFQHACLLSIPFLYFQYAVSFLLGHTCVAWGQILPRQVGLGSHRHLK